MCLYIALPILFFLALIQSTWVNHLAISFIVPNILLAFLVVLTIRSGRRTGIIWAFFAGVFLTLMSPFPFSGDLIALLLAIGVIGILGESVFGTVSPWTLIGQGVVATVVFTVSKVLLSKLTATVWGVPVDVSWGVELIHLFWLLLYQIGLVWVIYLLWEWIEQKFVTWHERPGLKRSKFF